MRRQALILFLSIVLTACSSIPPEAAQPTNVTQPVHPSGQPAIAQSFESEVAAISDAISASIVRAGKRKVAVLDFSDLQGNPNELGRFLSEQISLELVNGRKDFAVVDRASLNSILTEHNLTAMGLVNPDNAKKLGQFSGVDAIILGSITPLENEVILTAQIVATDTAEVVGAAREKIAKTEEIEQLLGRGLDYGPAQTGSGAVYKGTGKDFIAPNSRNVFENIAVDIVSFKISGPDNVIALVRVENRSRTNAVRIGLNSNNSGQMGTFLEDDQGQLYPLVRTEGLSFSRNFYGSDANTFEALRRMASAAERDGDTYGQQHQLFDDLDKDTDIAAGQSVIFMLQFGKRARTLGVTFRFNAEMIVAEMLKNERVKVSLRNVVIPGIQPK